MKLSTLMISRSIGRFFASLFDDGVTRAFDFATFSIAMSVVLFALTYGLLWAWRHA